MSIEQSGLQCLVGREFRHFKGGHYRLEGLAKDSETLEEMVVYRALYGEGGGGCGCAPPRCSSRPSSGMERR